jgi:hypothetical protein
MRPEPGGWDQKRLERQAIVLAVCVDQDIDTSSSTS